MNLVKKDCLMNSLVTRIKLSVALKTAIEDKPFCDTWEIPKVTSSLRNDAKRMLPLAEAELELAKISDRQKWLMTLGVLCSGNLTAADAKEKLSAYGYLLKYSDAVFTEETLEGAGRKFTWFPSFSELASFLDELELPILNRVARLSKIASAKIDNEPQSKQEPIDERRAHAKKIMREFTESMKPQNG